MQSEPVDSPDAITSHEIIYLFVPLRISKFKSLFFIDLLLLSEYISYYLLIVDLKSFNILRIKQSRSRHEICRNCFHVCNSIRSLENHQASFYAYEAAVIILPEEERKFHRFKKTSYLVCALGYLS